MQNNTPSPQAPQHDSDEIDLLALLGALIDSKWIVIGLTCIFAVAGAIYALTATPIFQATALIQIEEKSGGNLSGLSEIGDMFGSTSKAVTEIELLKSRAVVGKAVDDLNLDIKSTPNYFPLIGEWAARQFKKDDKASVADAPLSLESYAWGGEKLIIFQLSLPSQYLGKELTLVANSDQRFSIFSEDKIKLATGAVGELVTSADGLKVQVSKLSARPGTVFLLKKNRRLNTIIEYQQRIIASEKGKDSGIISLSLLSSDPTHATAVLNEISRLYVRQNVERNSAEAAQSLEFLKEQLPQVRKELEKYEQALNDYQTSTKSVDISIETQAILDQIVELDTLISEQNLKRAELERRFTRQHPSYQALLDQMEQLKRQKNELTTKVEGLPETQQELLRLTRDVEVTTEVYTALLNRSQELDVMRAGTVGNVRIIDTAVANIENPVKPQKTLVVLIATLLGGITGIVFVLARHAINKGVEDPDVIERLGMSVYAAIPFSKDQENTEQKSKHRNTIRKPEPPLLAISNPADLAVEALRSLRTSLHFARFESTNNVLMISGPTPGVGKSFVSANLAVIMAQAGKKVLLIDGDMRKGYLNKIFKTPVENGMSELLASRISSAEAIRETEVEGLSVVTRGTVPPNPSELLMHQNFSSFIENAKSEYDIVIIDTPPILAVTDSAIVGRQAGMSLIVTRFGVSTAREIDLARRRFEQNEIRLKGVIFNAVVKKASVYGYGNYGYYSYEYKSDEN